MDFLHLAADGSAAVARVGAQGGAIELQLFSQQFLQDEMDATSYVVEAVDHADLDDDDVGVTIDAVDAHDTLGVGLGLAPLDLGCRQAFLDGCLQPLVLAAVDALQ